MQMQAAVDHPATSELADKVQADLKKMSGVREIGIEHRGESLVVNVTMDTFDLGSFEKVIQEELDLTDQFPSLAFSFNVVFAESAE